MEGLENLTIGEFVAKDFRTAAVFTKYGIDFCCKGNRTISEACQKKNIDAAEVIKEVDAVLSSGNDGAIDFNSWPLDLLADYIERTHHRYVEEKTVVLLQFLNKLCKVHGSQHPELFEINALFVESANDLAIHMKKEEMVLFPFVKKMAKAIETGESIATPMFGTVENPIMMMKHEHENEGDRFRKIAELTSNYTPPADACNTYRAAFAMLNDFEKDLHKHIHLENNIMFPKAIVMEGNFST